MRVFTFFLMMIVAVAGMSTGYRVITGKDLVNFADFGLGTQGNSSSAVAAAQQAAAPTPRPSPTPEPVVTPTLTLTPTRAPDAVKTMLVGNTDGQGVYLRRSPHLEDKLQAWVDGSKMEVLSGPIESEGRQWFQVRAPNGVEGYIPSQFLVNAP